MFIAVRADAADDPAVIYAADLLGVTEMHLVGTLVAVWGWALTASDDGVVDVPRNWIDKRFGMPGLCDALLASGIAEESRPAQNVRKSAQLSQDRAQICAYSGAQSAQDAQQNAQKSAQKSAQPLQKSAHPLQKSAQFEQVCICFLGASSNGLLKIKNKNVQSSAQQRLQRTAQRTAQASAQQGAQAIAQQSAQGAQGAQGAQRGGKRSVDLDALADFEKFWAAYPKRRDKKRAQTAFLRLSASQRQTAIDDLPQRIASDPAWRDPQFIPLPSTYLRNERFADDWQGSLTRRHIREIA